MLFDDDQIRFYKVPKKPKRYSAPTQNAGFDPSQARDDQGQWTDTGGGTAAAISPEASEKKPAATLYKHLERQWIEHPETVEFAEHRDSPLWKEKYEVGIVNLADGTSVRIDGSEHEIKIPPDVSAKMKDSVFTHNHPGNFSTENGKSLYPGGSTFSPQDVWSAAWNDVKEIRAFGEDFSGNRWLTSLKRPPEGWDVGKVADMLNDIQKQSFNAEIGVLNQFHMGEIPKDETWKPIWNHRNEIWERITQKYGFSYDRRRVN